MKERDNGVFDSTEIMRETLSGMPWIRLTHIRTGLSVECRETQSIRKNEDIAWKKLETLVLNDVCKKMGETAKKEAFAKNLPICYIKDGVVVLEYPDGRIIPKDKV